MDGVKVSWLWIRKIVLDNQGGPESISQAGPRLSWRRNSTCRLRPQILSQSPSLPFLMGLPLRFHNGVSQFFAIKLLIYIPFRFCWNFDWYTTEKSLRAADSALSRASSPCLPLSEMQMRGGSSPSSQSHLVRKCLRSPGSQSLPSPAVFWAKDSTITRIISPLKTSSQEKTMDTFFFGRKINSCNMHGMVPIHALLWKSKWISILNVFILKPLGYNGEE